MNGTSSTANTESNEGTVSLSLGGAAGKTTTRAEGTTEATSEEKQIGELYAVLFRSVSTTIGTSGTASTESDTDLFIKTVNLMETGTNVTTVYSAESGAAAFKAPTDNYQICFIANPGTELATAINSLKLGESTVKDFKTLVEKQAPDNKPMLMTSDFYTAKVTKDGTTDLGTVSMVRAMARIDVVNKANGITLTGITFKNRTIKTDLINDNNTTLNADYLEGTAKEYANLAIKGNSDATATTNAYKATIYTYEQYGTDGNAPEMEITYTIDGQAGKTYKHTIKFEKTESEGATATQINLKRNHLYTVNLTNNADKLIVTLVVADWNEGTVFEMSTRKLVIGTTDYRYVALGDIMLSDGSFVKPSEYAATGETKAIGVVAYLYTDDSRVGNGVKTALAAKGESTPHGLVLALKNAGSGIEWSASSTYANSNYVYTSLNAAYNGADGYTLTKNVLADDTSLSTFKAFNAVKTFRTNNTVPENATDWYLPSMGEWIDMMSTSGIGGVNVSNVISATVTGKEISITNPSSATVCGNINTFMDKVGSENYDAFNADSSCFWSSSEYTERNAYGVFFYSGGSILFGNGQKVGYADLRKVRCILAF